MAVSSGTYIIGTSNTVLTGSIDPTASTTVNGVGTAFLTELAIGTTILVSGEERIIATITNDTLATVTVAFSDNANDTSPERLADYSDIGSFEADIDTQLTGNLTVEHKAEQTTTSAQIIFDTDTNSSLLKLTARDGDEHNGGAYGNGARISFGAGDGIEFDETGAGDLADIEISKLAFSGANNTVVLELTDCGDSGGILVNRCLIYGGGGTNVYGIKSTTSASSNITILNNIIYDLVNGTSRGLSIVSSSRTYFIANNTVINCVTAGIWQDHPSDSSNTTVKNNLVQACAGGDFVDDGAGFGTTSKNISEDSSGPDAAYDDTEINDDNFLDIDNDDFRLQAGEDQTILDDGDDLSGTFTDDIEGNIRSTWYIGASEIAAPGGVSPTSTIYGPLVGPLGGPV